MSLHPPFAPTRMVPLIRTADLVLRRSARLAVHDPEGLIERVREGAVAVFVCRHGELWPVLWAVRGTRTRVLVSQSHDGELLARLLGGWGFGVCRGSTSKAGFSGARGALRALRQGLALGLAIDGPRGPRGEVQDGALRLARRARVPVVPLRADGGGTWVLRRSWDHFQIPRPFARIQVHAGPEIVVGPGALGLANAAAAVQRALDSQAGPHPPESLPVRAEASL